MKFRNYLIPVALLVCMFLSGFTRSVAQDVELHITLPYSGNYNFWSIDLISYSTGETYHFDTDDDTFESNLLGTVPAGTYRIEFQSTYTSEGFDYGVTGPTYYHYHADGSSYTWYGAVIEDGTWLAIDEGY
jgi:hypothetical protein